MRHLGVYEQLSPQTIVRYQELCFLLLLVQILAFRIPDENERNTESAGNVSIHFHDTMLKKYFFF